jgi:signal transduction histidine kinase
MVRLKLVLGIFALLCVEEAEAQDRVVDSLRQCILTVDQDSSRSLLLSELSEKMLGRNIDSAQLYAEQALQLAEEISFPKGEATARQVLASVYQRYGRKEQALRELQKSLGVFKDINFAVGIARTHRALAGWHLYWKSDTATQNSHLRMSLEIYNAIGDSSGKAKCLQTLGNMLFDRGQTDQALGYLARCLRLSKLLGDDRLAAMCQLNIGIVHLRRGETAIALKSFTKSRDMAIGTGDQHLAAGCILRIGLTYDRLGRTGEAINALQRAQSMFRQLQSPRGEVQAAIEIATTMRARQPDEALRLMKEAQELAHRHGLASEEATALFAAGQIYVRRADFAAARKCFLQVRSMIQDGRNNALLSRALHGLGMVNYYAGKLDSALYYTEECLRVARIVDDVEAIRMCYVNIGTYRLVRGEYDAALTSLQEAREMIVSSGVKRESVAVLNTIGLVYQRQGKLSLALKQFLEALTVAEELGDPYLLVQCLQKVSDVYLREAQYAKALSIATRGIEVAEKVGAKRFILWCKLNAGTARLSLDMQDEAFKDLSEAYEIAQKIGDVDAIANAASTLALYCRMNHRYSEALTYALQAMNIWEKIGSQANVASSLCDIGWTYSCLRDYDNAIKHLERSLSLAGKLVLPGTKKCALRRLHKVYAEANDHQNAYEYYQRLVAYQDSVRELTDEERREELLAVYEAEQREREIELLEKDKALQALELSRRDEMLRRHAVERLQRLQEIELLSRTSELQQLEMDMTAANLRSKEAEAAQKQQKISLLEKDGKLKAASLDRETMLRNGTLLGALLLLILSAVLYRHHRQRRRLSELRADVAESRMHAAEVEAFRVQAEAERREKEAQRQFSHRLLDSQEQERKHIAAELHDSLGQDLIVIKNSLLMVKDHAGTEEDLDRAIADLGGALNSVRRLSRDLRPLQLDYYGIEKALRALAARIEESTPLQVRLEFGQLEDLLDKEGELNVYRIVQEGLNNVLKHAEAKSATVNLLPDNGVLVLSIEDDGKGMTDDPAERERLLATGFGLKGMEERVSILGGTMNINSTIGKGTYIEIRIPFHDHNPLHAKLSQRETV